jgi:hypothetical protein
VPFDFVTSSLACLFSTWTALLKKILRNRNITSHCSNLNIIYHRINIKQVKNTNNHINPITTVTDQGWRLVQNAQPGNWLHLQRKRAPLWRDFVLFERSEFTKSSKVPCVCANVNSPFVVGARFVQFGTLV